VIIHVKGCIGLDGERTILVNLLRARAGLPADKTVRLSRVPDVYYEVRKDDDDEAPNPRRSH
jgi:hypothetical protein